MYYLNNEKWAEFFAKSVETFDLYRDKVRILRKNKFIDDLDDLYSVNFDINNENDRFISGISKNQYRYVSSSVEKEQYNLLKIGICITPNGRMPHSVLDEYCNYLETINENIFLNPSTSPLANNPLIHYSDELWVQTNFGVKLLYTVGDDPYYVDSCFSLKYSPKNKLFTIPTNDEERADIGDYGFLEELIVLPKHVIDITEWLFMQYYDSMVDYLIKIGREDCIKYTQIQSFE